MEKKTLKSRLINRLMRYFFQGLLLMAPIAITGYVFVVLVRWMDGLIKWDIPEKLDVPGLGSLVIILGLTLVLTFIGFLSSTFIFKPIFRFFEKLISNTPLIKIIYTSIKDLFSAFVSEKKKFNKPVLVRLNKEIELYKIGFITQEDLSKLDIKNKVAVYLPHSYAWSGNLFIVPKENIKPLKNISAANTMKFVISGGVTEIK